MQTTSLEKPANALSGNQMRHRNLGFDLFRFWGVFCIFIGHNYNIAIGVAYSKVTNPNFAVMNAPTWWQSFVYPSLWMDLVLTGVPLFIIIAGYHSLGKSCRPTDWVDTKKTFVKYFVFWFKWLIVGGLLLVLFPAVFDAGWPNNPILSFSNIGEVFEMLLENIVGTSSGKGFHAMNAINWTTIALAWAAVLCFLMRPVYQSKNIKAIRMITLIAFVMCLLVPTIRDVGTYLFAQNPDSLVFTFMKNFSILDTTGFRAVAGDWNNFWFPMLMLGGWYAVDEQIHNKVRSWSWGKIAAVCIPLVVLYVIIGFYGGLISGYTAVVKTPVTIYWRCGWFPASAAWFIIADKINATCKEDSKLGRFILKFGEDNIGAMIISWPLGSILQGAVFHGVYTWMNANITSGPAYALAFLSYNVVFYAVLVLIVHLLRPIFSKIPFLRGLLYWDKIKMFDKEKERILANEALKTN